MAVTIANLIHYWQGSRVGAIVLAVGEVGSRYLQTIGRFGQVLNGGTRRQIGVCRNIEKANGPFRQRGQNRVDAQISRFWQGGILNQSNIEIVWTVDETIKVIGVVGGEAGSCKENGDRVTGITSERNKGIVAQPRSRVFGISSAAEFTVMLLILVGVPLSLSLVSGSQDA